MTYYENRKKILIFSLIGVLIIVILTIFSSTLGAANITFSNALKILLNKIPIIGLYFDSTSIPKMQRAIVLNLRLPRILLAIMVGGMLASSGTVYQSVFRNPMADPFVLGISSGAALGAALAMIMGFNIGTFGISSISISAFMGAMLTTIVVYRIATTNRKTPVLTLVLSGIAISFFLSAMLSLLITFNRDKLEQIIFWMYGSFATASWKQIIIVFPVYLFTNSFLFFKGRILNMMTLGEEGALSLGVDVHKERILLLSVASLATAISVSVTGIIGFVGLVIPHMLRILTGADNRILLPFSILSGGGFMLVCDALARTVVAPLEVPIGIITSVLGAPYFIYLIVKNKKRGGY